MGRVIEGQDKERLWGETANTKGPLKRHMETRSYRSFLTYVNTRKDLKRNYHITGETMSQLDSLRYHVKPTAWGKVCVIVCAVACPPQPDGKAEDQRAGGQLEAPPLLTSAHGEKRYHVHNRRRKVITNFTHVNPVTFSRNLPTGYTI